MYRGNFYEILLMSIYVNNIDVNIIKNALHLNNNSNVLFTPLINRVVYGKLQ